MGKIIFLGFPKCGTLSFYESLKIAGFKTAHYYNSDGKIIGDLISMALAEGKKLLHYVDSFDAITQMDCYRYESFICPQTLYWIFDKQYPGTKFILNTRNFSDHIRSIAYWGDLIHRMNGHIDVPAFFASHYNGVRRYFRHRDNFIEYNLDSDKEEKLSSFLGREIKLVHINKTNYEAS